MKVKDILKILEVVEKLPADMYDIVEESNYDGAYYSDSQNRYIPVRDMDIVHLLRSFKKLNEYQKDARDMYIHMGHIKEKANAK